VHYKGMPIPLFPSSLAFLWPIGVKNLKVVGVAFFFMLRVFLKLFKFCKFEIQILLSEISPKPANTINLLRIKI